MKSGTCPKCGSSQVYTATDLPLKGGPFSSNSIPISLTSMASLDNYVCVDCGSVERYVADEFKLKEVERKWELVSESKEKTDKKAEQD